MAGVGEAIGTPLDKTTAPEFAVHGTYLKNLDTILSDGLSKMGRHHVHLARGLLGETGVVSGMRHNTQVYVWVAVHVAMDSGIRFFETSNGVILCEGFNGVLSPQFFSVVIEVRGGLMLSAPQVRLIERLFAGCSRVVVKKMHGGFSGSLVLRTDSYDADGHPEEPTVTKIDDGQALVREVHETDYIATAIGSDAIRVLRGPTYVNQNVDVIEAVDAEKPPPYEDHQPRGSSPSATPPPSTPGTTPPVSPPPSGASTPPSEAQLRLGRLAETRSERRSKTLGSNSPLSQRSEADGSVKSEVSMTRPPLERRDPRRGRASSTARRRAS